MCIAHYIAKVVVEEEKKGRKHRINNTPVNVHIHLSPSMYGDSVLLLSLTRAGVDEEVHTHTARQMLGL